MVNEDVYEKLRARKRSEERFSDQLDRLTDEHRDLHAGFGAWANSEKTERMREAHDRLNRSLGFDAERRLDAE